MHTERAVRRRLVATAAAAARHALVQLHHHFRCCRRRCFCQRRITIIVRSSSCWSGRSRRADVEHVLKAGRVAVGVLEAAGRLEAERRRHSTRPIGRKRWRRLLLLLLLLLLLQLMDDGRRRWQWRRWRHNRLGLLIVGEQLGQILLDFVERAVEINVVRIIAVTIVVVVVVVIAA